MAYVTKNFKSKKALKDAVANGEKHTVYAPGIGPDYSHRTGNVTVEGPHFPEPHKWYAEVELQDGVIVKVK